MSEPIQFDRAEPLADAPPPALICASCRSPIAERYFEVNGKTACTPCFERADHGRKARPTRRFLTAIALGIGAGAIGAGVYYAVAELSGYEFGLIGILVGWLVGKAVRRGSGAGGGRGYQVLAVAITYLAIVSTYAPGMFKGIEAQNAKEARAAAQAQPAADAPNLATPPAPALASNPTAAAGTPSQGSQEVSAVASERQKPSAGQFAGAILVLIGLLLATPFLSGADNLMGLAIIGFSLWEAWKFSQASPWVVRGPFAVSGDG